MAQIKKEKYLEYLLKLSLVKYIFQRVKKQRKIHMKNIAYEHIVFYDVSTGWMRIVDI